MPPCLRIALVLTALTLARPAAARQQPGDLDRTIQDGFRVAYNLDTDAALATMRRAVSLGPSESRAHRALAAVLWLDCLFDRGAVTVDHYLAGITRGALSLPAPRPALESEFKRELGLAIDLAQGRLDRNKHDVQARFDLGSAYGLQASYLASVEGSTGAAFLAARKAFDAQEQVLHDDPRRASAGVVLGTYRYLVSSLNLAGRLVAYMAGFGGDKQLGIELLEAAARDPESHVEATTALLLVYTREGRHADALRMIHELVTEFPRNRLFLLEEGATALRARRPGEADALLSRGLAALDADNRPQTPGERALWLYKRAQARLAANRRLDAGTDLQVALSNDPPQWLRGRIALARGKAADLAHDRPEALTQYRLARAIAGTVNDPLADAEAAALLRRPWAVPTIAPK
jgi:tetratricopeptide (TPR) repeat protein